MRKVMTIVVDAGSSKAEWAPIYSDGTIGESLLLPGINPVMADTETMIGQFRSVASDYVGSTEAEEIYYYGAGCATPEICSRVDQALARVWPGSRRVVASDLVGAAKALLGKERGIACILGTGSNSGLFDGEKIVANIPPLGFILGDEGSGAALGKRLINEIFKGNIPEEVRKKFFLDTGLSLPEIIENVYRRPAPNKFIASLVPFIRNHIDNPFLYNMVVEEFVSFFRHNVNPYPDAHLYRPAFTGSVAFHFKDCLQEAARRENYEIGKVEKAPMEALLDFHLNIQGL
ncbi:MAG: ATPase [Muribaculaceae bacterium]|nr:ATPase [Muribaculaceae bacterium]